MRIWLAAGFWLLAVPALAADEAPSWVAGDTITGPMLVDDGDGLLFGETRIRLFGLRAPEINTPAGWYARAALDRLTEGRVVTCRVRDIDRYQRPVALCETEAGDLSLSMIGHGYGLIYERFMADQPEAPAYRAAERGARDQRRGLWQDLPRCLPPGPTGNAGGAC